VRRRSPSLGCPPEFVQGSPTRVESIHRSCAILVGMSRRYHASDLDRLFRRCGARIKRPWRNMPNGTIKHRHPFCRLRPMPGKTRCRYHGGLSTGPKTHEGKVACVEGRRRWLAQLKAKGVKAPSGRKPGAAWVTAGMKRKLATEEAERLARLEAEQLAAIPRHVREAQAVIEKIHLFQERLAAERWQREELPVLLGRLNEERKAAEAVARREARQRSEERDAAWVAEFYRQARGPQP